MQIFRGISNVLPCYKLPKTNYNRVVLLSDICMKCNWLLLAVWRSSPVDGEEASRLSSYADSLAYRMVSGYTERYTNPPAPATSAFGRLTGNRTYLLDIGEEILIAYYYDDCENVVQSRSTNHLGGYDSNFFAYTLVVNLRNITIFILSRTNFLRRNYTLMSMIIPIVWFLFPIRWTVVLRCIWCNIIMMSFAVCPVYYFTMGE